MKFSHKHNSHNNETIELHNKTFTISDRHTDLGIIFDPKLSISFHIDNVKAKLYRKTGFMWRFLRRIKNIEIFKIWVHSIILSNIQYGLPIYSSASNTQIAKIDKAIYHIVKTLSNMSHFQQYSKNSIYVIMKIKSFNEMTALADHKIILKYVEGLLPPDMIYFHVPQFYSRKNNFLNIHKFRTNKFRNSFHIRAATSYNNIAY